MKEDQPYWIIAFYKFTSIEDPHKEVKNHKAFFADKDVTCRIYLSENGINAQMCAARETAKEYMEWQRTKPGFDDVVFKIDGYHEQIFPRVTVKYRKQLVAIDEVVDLSKGGEHVSPETWKQMLQAQDGHVVLDIRNDYEWELGHFEGAEPPPCQTFRDFIGYADQLKERVEPHSTPVMMYCTGGIRCELYSSILLEKGFEKVYQLDGGVINYGHKQGTDHWLGKLFVFDDRLSVPIADDPAPIIGKCHCCDVPNEDYYNCANMDCNKLFLNCKICLTQHNGCCSAECAKSPRLRPVQEQHPHKPFRKWYQYFEQPVKEKTPEQQQKASEKRQRRKARRMERQTKSNPSNYSHSRKSTE
jgi:UPF0176 protein